MSGWNPDAVPPPCGDIYERERPARGCSFALGRIAALTALLVFAGWLWSL